MWKLLTFILAATMLVTSAGCGRSIEDSMLTTVNESSVAESTVVQESIAPKEEVPQATHVFTQIKESPDK